MCRRTKDERGQSLPLVIAAVFVVLLGAAIVTAVGGAVTGAEGAQRGADLAALSAVRSMRDELPRLVTPARLPDGRPNPRHLGRARYLADAQAAAREAASRNGLDPRRVRVSFPDRVSPTPLRARVAVSASLDVAHALPASAARRAGRISIEARAEAAASVPVTYEESPTMASGGGYSGPLAYRTGKPMRPDVAVAFDRLAAAAAGAGIQLVVVSGFRSDAEQARLWAQNPDPRWVAPPGTSLHRCATELDLGPSTAYGWLAANASRFGFLKRYPWEAWHFGYVQGPAPCSAAGNSLGAGAPDGSAAGSGLPPFVPGAYRDTILRSAARWNVPTGLIAAQLEAESGFNPNAVSPAGAQGIAQFMPGTAASYGLRDPFDAVAAIDAEAHLMSDLLHQFGSTSLALAAYNAGPAPVLACRCVPSFPETQAYVARILGLMGASGEVAPPQLEVRLVS
jgi:transglycosylase-like protein with SLT domain/D-alanyl-D-alanine carboxypeptidase-like protein/putative Flp pilus-assembly TadE/G-like protein